jgi:P27 family predicted phage terminase small subunit
MAPPAKPIELHALDGTKRPDRHGDGSLEVGVPVDLANVKPPSYFTASHKAAWRDVVAIVHPVVTQTADLPAVEMMAVSLATFRDAVKALKADGAFVESPNGYRIAHPAAAIRDKAAAEYRAWAAKFGLTPADRVALGITAKRAGPGAGIAGRIGASPRAAK